jgi:MFS family permease
MAEYRSARAVLARLWQSLVHLSAGGSWSVQQPAQVRRNLRWYFSDAVTSTASDSIPLTYLSLYILALGATRAQIGLLSALSSLVSVLFLVPGAILAERWGKRKLIVLASGGFLYRLSFPVLALLPFMIKGAAVVPVAIAVKVLADGFANFGYPAWMSMTADIVPLAWRGRYFANRNIVIGIVGMAITLGIGQLITSLGSPVGYQVSLGIALVFGILATFSYAQIDIPENPPVEKQVYSLAGVVKFLREDPNFLAYVIHAMVWNGTIGIAGPFFGVYQVQDLSSTAAMVGVVAIAGSIAGLPATRWFGRLSDRLGPHRVMTVCGLLIPLLPIFWIFTRQPWHAIPVSAFGGLVWAGFNLAAFNFALSLAPSHQIPRYSALLQVAVAIAVAAGAALGGVIATQWGYHAVFLVSGIGRFLGIFIFLRFVRPVKPELSGNAPANI